MAAGLGAKDLQPEAKRREGEGREHRRRGGERETEREREGKKREPRNRKNAIFQLCSQMLLERKI